jgi:hypothetical protein
VNPEGAAFSGPKLHVVGPNGLKPVSGSGDRARPLCFFPCHRHTLPCHLITSLLFLPPHGPWPSLPQHPCLPPSAHNFPLHVTKRPRRWLGAWRRTLKSVPLHAPSNFNALLSMSLFVSADVHSMFPIFPHFNLPSYHVPARTMKWLVACTRTLTRIFAHATRHCKSACSYLFLFLGDLAPHAPPFHRIRHSQCMRMAMPRYRTFRMPNCVGHWRGTPSCILSPPGLPQLGFIVASRLRCCPCCTRIWRAVRHPKHTTNCYVFARANFCLRRARTIFVCSALLINNGLSQLVCHWDGFCLDHRS